ncbi:unnamed protein product [Onchocerca ochengi]|uniref:Uncharacterized protein n=2 Tax=Onchocerca TaxID=6281 RepID=A0A182EA12_ONCOC|nr:unnamed protein product [Onchocerca ochengi]
MSITFSAAMLNELNFSNHQKVLLSHSVMKSLFSALIEDTAFVPLLRKLLTFACQNNPQTMPCQSPAAQQNRKKVRCQHFQIDSFTSSGTNITSPSVLQILPLFRGLF